MTKQIPYAVVTECAVRRQTSHMYTVRSYMRYIRLLVRGDTVCATQSSIRKVINLICAVHKEGRVSFNTHVLSHSCPLNSTLAAFLHSLGPRYHIYTL